MTQLKTKDIPAIIGLRPQALATLMEDMGREYAKWWCGQSNHLEAVLLYENQTFQDWWLKNWLIQDERFLSTATAHLKRGVSQKSMLAIYLNYHRPANEQVEADGGLIMWKTMLPQTVQKSFAAERTGLDRSVRELITSISDN